MVLLNARLKVKMTDVDEGVETCVDQNMIKKLYNRNKQEEPDKKNTTD